jgi:hypothetical protein
VSRRLQTFLYSRKNIAGSLLALGGLALHFTGLIVGLEWLPITAGLYLIGALLVPGERALDLRLDATADASDIRGALDSLMKSIRGRVPDDIYASVSNIRDSIMVTLQNGNGGGHAAVDPNVYLIRQTALSYLPEALNAYLALPRLYANRSLGGRKSAHDTLLDQLNLMNQKMTEVAEAIVAHDTDRLEAHGRFLAEKFGGSTLDIASPAAQVTAAASPAARPAEADTVRDRIRG